MALCDSPIALCDSAKSCSVLPMASCDLPMASWDAPMAFCDSAKSWHDCLQFTEIADLDQIVVRQSDHFKQGVNLVGFKCRL